MLPEAEFGIPDAYHCVEPVRLERFLERRRANPNFPLELSLAENLVEVLRRANGFVPSAAGSILLDDPSDKQEDRRQNRLTFIAAFGEKSQGLVGETIPADQGIAGRVYLTGETYSTPYAPSDRFFYRAMDEQTRYQTQSLVAIPIRIEQEVCGVLELINRLDAPGYSQEDLNLLEIFAGYISISIQNVLDGRQAQEIAKRDNLTGLYNDRYLHIALSETIRRCQSEDQDLALLFLDLDYFKQVNDTHGHLAGQPGAARGGAPAAPPGQGRPGASPPATAATSSCCCSPAPASTRPSTWPRRSAPPSWPTPSATARATSSPSPCTSRGSPARSASPPSSSTWSRGCPSTPRKSTLLRLADAAMYVAKETGRNRTALAGQPVRRRTGSPRTPFVDPFDPPKGRVLGFRRFLVGDGNAPATPNSYPKPQGHSSGEPGDERALT